MGGFFGAISKHDCVLDLFFGVDYEVDEPHAALREEGLQYLVDLEGHGADGVDLLPGKDRFRRDLGNVEEAYEEMMRRVFGA